MGVKGLWSLLKEKAIATRLEALQGKTVAVDASIWLYHFAAAMRDAEGNMLRAAHLVGFFRRICKLIFYGIKPVFVFDGGVPHLKLKTIQKRRHLKRKGAAAVEKTANQILQAQLKLHALQSVSKEINEAHSHAPDKRQGELLDLLHIKGSSKRWKDDPLIYQLPEIPELIPGNQDPRLISSNELEMFIRDTIDDNALNELNIDSPQFNALPIEIQYKLANDLRLKSRAPNAQRVRELTASADPLDFSLGQIRNLVHRSTLSSKVSAIAQAKKDGITKGRIVGARQREFIILDNCNGIGQKLRLKESEFDALASIKGMAGFSESKVVTISKSKDVKNDEPTNLFTAYESFGSSSKKDNCKYSY